MPKLLLAAGVAAICLVQPVQAADINEQGARALKDSLGYFLPDRAKSIGFLTVAPAGDHYRIGYDFAKLLDSIDKKDFSVSGLTPLSMSAKPLDNGQWQVDGSNSLNIGVKGTAQDKPLDITYSLTDMVFSGVFDPAISYLRSGEAKSGPIRMVSKSGAEEIEASFAGLNYSLTSQNSPAAGSVDFQGKGSFQRFYERIAAPETPPVEIRADSLDFDVGVQGVVADKIRNLMALMIELIRDDKPSDQEVAKLKDLIRGAMPFFTGLSEKISFNRFAVLTPAGDFGVDKLDYNLTMSEPSQATRVGFGLGLQSVSVPAGIVPDVYAKLIPDMAEVQVGVVDLNFTDFVNTLLAMDLSKPGPMTDQESEKLGQAFLKDGQLKIDFPKVVARSSLYDMEATGKVSGYPAEKDRYSLETSVLMRDVDKLIKFVQGAAKTDPEMNKVAFGMMMAKGMAKTEPDGRLRWDIAFTDGKSLTVNGQPLQ